VIQSTYGRADAFVLWREFLGELTRFAWVEVPVPGLSHDQPLGGLQAERVHVGDEGVSRQLSAVGLPRPAISRGRTSQSSIVTPLIASINCRH
jgi:hypothetical protein